VHEHEHELQQWLNHHVRTAVAVKTAAYASRDSVSWTTSLASQHGHTARKQACIKHH
jgi:hypothetical protein